MFSYFTAASANAALGKIVRLRQHALQRKVEVIRTEQRMQALLADNADIKSYVLLKQELNAKVTEYHRAIESLEETGVVVKNLDDGLLDFPSKRFDEDVWLCWKDGEESVKFWHEKHTGFMGRKPIEVSNESLV